MKFHDMIPIRSSVGTSYNTLCYRQTSLLAPSYTWNTHLNLILMSCTPFTWTIPFSLHYLIKFYLTFKA